MNPLADVEIRYKCECMPEEVAVLVPARFDFEDIREWMNKSVSMSLYLDHRRRSPNCGAKKVEYVKLPVNDQTQIGGALPRN